MNIIVNRIIYDTNEMAKDNCLIAQRYHYVISYSGWWEKIYYKDGLFFMETSKEGPEADLLSVENSLKVISEKEIFDLLQKESDFNINKEIYESMIKDLNKRDR